MAPALDATRRNHTTMAKSIKFTASGSCNAIGSFAPGDVARNIPDELAAHLVHEAQCAQYLPVSAKKAPAAAPPWPPAGTEPAPAASVAKTTRKTKTNANDAAP